MSISRQAIFDALRNVIEPDLKKDIVELGLVIYLLRANVHTPAEQLAFDLIATVGVAGLMSRLSNLRKKVSQ